MEPHDPSAMSVRALKAELTSLGVASSDCTEKRELIDRLHVARQRKQATGAKTADGKTTGTHRTQAHQRPMGATAPPSVPDASDASPEAAEIRRVLRCNPAAVYHILDVPHDSGDDQIKKAYRRLAMKLHPDKCQCGGSDEAFKRVGAAFATLSDSSKRRMHDLRGGDAGVHEPPGGQPHGSQRGRPFTTGAAFGDRDAEDLFRAFFGADYDFGARAPTAGGARSEVRPAAGSEVAHRAAGLVSRLATTFARNPWALVTLLSALASMVSIMESLTTIFGKWLVVALPAAGFALVQCPSHHRRSLGALAAVLLFSGVLL